MEPDYNFNNEIKYLSIWWKLYGNENYNFYFVKIILKNFLNLGVENTQQKIQMTIVLKIK